MEKEIKDPHSSQYFTLFYIQFTLFFKKQENSGICVKCILIASLY